MSDQIVFTLGVAKIDLAKQFYQDVLGLAGAQDYPQFLSFKAADNPTSMALYTGDALAYDVAVAERAEGFRGVMFSCIVDNNGRVDQVMARVKERGGTTLEEPHEAKWGGYLGYFADPDGNLWKVVSPQRPGTSA